MYSLPQYVGKLIKDYLITNLNSLNRVPEVWHYVDIFCHHDDTVRHAHLDALRMAFEHIDKDFKHSKERKALYYTKGRRPRMLLTLWGELRFEREYYVPKSGKDGFFYVDRILGLPARDYYDPLIKATLIEASAKESYSRAGELAGALIGKRFKFVHEQRLARISRQTVRNIILSRELILEDEPRKPRKTDILYIQMDEKFISLQREDKKHHEVKAAVLYTDILPVSMRRRQLHNRRVFTTTGSAGALKDDISDYIAENYDTEHIETVFISGDGASWIKSSRDAYRFTPDVTTHFALDRFHMQQAVNHITPEPNIREVLTYYIREDAKEAFNQTCEAILDDNPHREDVIEEKQAYINRNWSAIQKQKHGRFKGCSVEGHISHILAAVFSSRPKGYTRRMLNHLLPLRTLYVNGDDIKKRYLQSHTDYFFRENIDVETAYLCHSKTVSSKSWHREMMKELNQCRFEDLRFL